MIPDRDSGCANAVVIPTFLLLSLCERASVMATRQNLDPDDAVSEL